MKLRELRKIAELYDLIESETSSGRALLDRADAQTLIGLRPRLLRKKEAGVILGFPTKSAVDSFIDNGLLIPFINGPSSMPETFRILEDDVLDLLSAIKRRCGRGKPKVETMTLGDPAAKVSLGAICQALLSGQIERAWIDREGGAGLRSIMIAKADVRHLYTAISRRKRSEDTRKFSLRPFSHWRDRALELTEPHRKRRAAKNGRSSRQPARTPAVGRQRLRSGSTG